MSGAGSFSFFWIWQPERLPYNFEDFIAGQALRLPNEKKMATDSVALQLQAVRRDGPKARPTDPKLVISVVMRDS